MLCCFLEQSAAEKVKAKMKLQLDEVGMLVGPVREITSSCLDLILPTTSFEWDPSLECYCKTMGPCYGLDVADKPFLLV